eukprot:CAMPEP_0204041554 /NCGR_PEP_ID=MMETSP0360-20130528/94940_1 /ASSEMBLY_ACC=CAM_ASM_000342 /TAXON_ID=268821 /ORGANISM="Scrippsiella Hangoei, Strain SHTV-5" /LENGTH=273 /DNA_ID=CAMNT_0050987717 /DNA_START=494 /DNA_END=1311 /DNA_ORIENTATION=-
MALANVTRHGLWAQPIYLTKSTPTAVCTSVPVSERAHTLSPHLSLVALTKHDKARKTVLLGEASHPFASTAMPGFIDVDIFTQALAEGLLRSLLNTAATPSALPVGAVAGVVTAIMPDVTSSAHSPPFSQPVSSCRSGLHAPKALGVIKSSHDYKIFTSSCISQATPSLTFPPYSRSSAITCVRGCMRCRPGADSARPRSLRAALTTLIQGNLLTHTSMSLMLGFRTMLTISTAFVTPLSRYQPLSSSLKSQATWMPLEAHSGTAARAIMPPS